MFGQLSIIAAALALCLRGEAPVDVALEAAGVHGELAVFLRAKAYVEARGNPLARNDGDGRAAVRAAARLRSGGRLPDCGRPIEEYGYSGGLFGLIPALVIVVSAETTGSDICEDPRAVFDGARATELALTYGATIQRRKSYRQSPTWESLWLGFRSPSLPGNPGSSKAVISLSNMSKGLRRTGGHLRGTPPPLLEEALHE